MTLLEAESPTCDNGSHEAKESDWSGQQPNLLLNIDSQSSSQLCVGTDSSVTDTTKREGTNSSMDELGSRIPVATMATGGGQTTTGKRSANDAVEDRPVMEQDNEGQHPEQGGSGKNDGNHNGGGNDEQGNGSEGGQSAPAGTSAVQSFPGKGACITGIQNMTDPIKYGPLRELLKLCSDGNCLFFYTHDKRGDTTGKPLPYSQIEQMDDTALGQAFNVCKPKWGQESKHKCRFGASFYFYSQKHLNVRALKQIPGVIPFLKLHNWQLKAHSLLQSQTITPLFIQGKHPHKTNTEAVAQQLMTYFQTEGINVPVAVQMTQLGADKVPILGIQCHIEDEPIFDKWAL
ncbi:hypothetical protein (Partial), partial [Seminavis robusta]